MRSFLLLLLSVSFAVAQTSGQYEVRKKNAGAGFTAYGVSLANGQALGLSGGVPAALDLQPLDAGLTSLSGLSPAIGALWNPGNDTLQWKVATDSPATGDEGKLVLYGESGGITGANFVNAADGTNPSYIGQLQPNSIYFLNINGSGHNYALSAPYPPGANRLVTFPDADGELLLANGDGSSLGNLDASNIATGSLSLARLAQGGATSGQVLGWNGAAWAPTAGGSGLTIGTTTIASGTSGRVLYDNAGTLGELATTGSGDVVRATSPTLVTPALGTPSALTLTNATGLPPAGVTGTAAVLGANTFTGAQTLSVNGALSAPALALTGTIITGGTATTTKPLVLIEAGGTASTAWSTSGTALGVNAASGFAGNLVDLQVAATSVLSYTYNTGGRGLLLMRGSGGGTAYFYVDPGKVSCAQSFQLNNATYYTSSDLNDTAGVLVARNYSDGVQFVLAGDGDAANNTIQMGLDANASPSAYTLKGSDGITGTDRNGTDVTLASGNSTGSGTSAVIISTPAAGSTGTTARTAAERLRVTSANITFTAPPRLPVYTVATLPSTAATGMVQGAEALVTDATAPTYLGTLTGGGAVVVPVIYNGSAWVSH